MRILLVGAGGVGDAIAKIAARRDFFETMVVSDYDISRAERTIAWIESKGQAGTWSGTGMPGPEAFDAKPFLDLMALPVVEGGYGQAWGLEER